MFHHRRLVKHFGEEFAVYRDKFPPGDLAHPSNLPELRVPMEAALRASFFKERLLGRNQAVPEMIGGKISALLQGIRRISRVNL